MPRSIRAQESSIGEVFAPGECLQMPHYQRSYSWGEKEALELLNDILEAVDENTAHFIGAIVLIEGQTRGVLEIVDGQQRLTTLTILFCVLRDLESDPEEAARIHNLIADPHRPMLGEGPSWRLSLNYVDGAFFRDGIQELGATLQLDRQVPVDKEERESQARMITNAAAFKRILETFPVERRRALASAASDACELVRVIVQERDQGFKVFRVLNTRGKEPDAHDIIKTEVFQRAKLSVTEANQYAELWAEHETALGGAAFDDLLRQIRMIYGGNTRGDLLSGFQRGVLSRIDARRFLDDTLPTYVNAYKMLETASIPEAPGSDVVADKLNQMRALEQQNWRAPALLFLAERGTEDPKAPEFFTRLERLAYVLMLLVHDREQRIRRLSRIVEAARNDRQLFASHGPFNISRDEARRARERLLGRFATYGQRRAIALRLNAALEGGRTIPPESDATVEHVLPRNPPEDSHWMITWPDAVRRREQCDTIGNYVLLTNKVNQKADRLDYRAKKEIYFNGGGGQEFALTRDLMHQDAWTPEVVRKRTETLASILAQDWQL
jgi:hypothetical protein